MTNPYVYTDAETVVVDSLPDAMHGFNTDWRMRAKAFLEGIEARGWKVVPAGGTFTEHVKGKS